MYPFEIRGITEPENVRGNSNEFFKKFALNEEQTDETCQLLVRNIPPQTMVTFYDKDYPSPSDPGTYVSFMRVNTEYLIERGNHGWRHKWVSLVSEDLESYLWKCSESHTLGAERIGIHLSKISEQRA